MSPFLFFLSSLQKRKEKNMSTYINLFFEEMAYIILNLCNGVLFSPIIEAGERRGHVNM